jgi:FAD synthetase
MTTAAILVIGNEVLSGKVEEENAQYMIQGLRRVGLDLKRVNIVRDDVNTIAHDIKSMSETYDVVFTSGGVGSTHDDVTISSIAQGLGLEIVQHPELYRLLAEHYGSRMNDAVLRMANVPEGAELLGVGELRFPLIRIKNVYIFPGVPQFLKAKFDFVLSLLSGVPMILECLYLDVGEDRVADLLGRVDAQMPDVEIGSYPRFDIEEYRVKITVESRDQAQLNLAMQRLKDELDAQWIVQR